MFYHRLLAFEHRSSFVRNPYAWCFRDSSKQDVQKLYISVGAPTTIGNVIKSGPLSRLRQFNGVENRGRNWVSGLHKFCYSDGTSPALQSGPGRAERGRYAPRSFRSRPFPHRRSGASTSCCSSLPRGPRSVPGNHFHREDTTILCGSSRSAARDGTSPSDADIFSQPGAHHAAQSIFTIRQDR